MSELTKSPKVRLQAPPRIMTWDNVILAGGVTFAVLFCCIAMNALLNFMFPYGSWSALTCAVFVLCTGYNAGRMAAHILAERREFRDLALELSILDYAEHERGRPLSVCEVALRCELRISDAAKALKKLSAQGVCRTVMTEDGDIHYFFHNFARRWLTDSSSGA